MKLQRVLEMVIHTSISTEDRLSRTVRHMLPEETHDNKQRFRNRNGWKKGSWCSGSCIFLKGQLNNLSHRLSNRFYFTRESNQSKINVHSRGSILVTPSGDRIPRDVIHIDMSFFLRLSLSL